MTPFHPNDELDYDVPLTGTVALTWLSGLRVPMTPRSMPAGVFTPLVGPPKLEWLPGQSQSHGPPGVGVGLEANNLIL